MIRHSLFRSALRPAFGAALVLCLLPGTAFAQTEDDDEPESVSIPVVQAVPSGDSERLNDALGRLGRNPRDLIALIDAGNAALAMGDADAAIGFFQRADTLSPNNSRVKAGLAASHVRREDPFTAIPLFAEAEKIAPLDAAAQLDRGLAYDLVGDNETAQRYYRAVLAAGQNDEARRRLALSLAISGDRAGMDATLAPLLQRQDKAAWRTRAFALAILGKAEDAEAIAKQTLAPDLAVAMAAYLRYMPRLTAAQQAAAGNLGAFPRAADIGHDDPRVALHARPRTAVAAADKPLVPTGQPLGRPGTSDSSGSRDSGGRRGSRRGEKPATPAAPPPAAPPEVQPSRAVVADSGPPRVFATPAPAATPTPAAAPTPTPPPPAPRPAATLAAATPPPPAPSPVVTTPASTPPSPSPAATTAAAATPGFTALGTGTTTPAAGFDLSRASGTAPVAPIPAPVAATPSPTPAPTPPKRGTLAEVFADFEAPSREVAPAEGAVDLRTITPARPAPPPAPAARAGTGREPAVTRGGSAPAKPAPPSHPSRIWIQLATGRDKAALGFDWRRFTREDPEVFKGKRGFTSAFGQSNRLLVGPFESQAQANAYLAQLRKAGVTGAFVWTSPAGQVVDALSVR